MDDPANVVWLPVAGGLLALGCLWGALRAAVRRLVDGLPTSKTTGVFIGLVSRNINFSCGRTSDLWPVRVSRSGRYCGSAPAKKHCW